jgi:hypothetical protein
MNQEYETNAYDVECNLGFLDEVDNLDNPADFSADRASSTKSQSSNDRTSPFETKSGEKQMVMIDQNQLQELLEAKRMLEC